MSRKLLIGVLAGVSMALTADEEPVESGEQQVWICGDEIRLKEGILMVDDDGRPNHKAGSVTLFGREYPAVFHQSGLTLSWLFGDEVWKLLSEEHEKFPGFALEAYLDAAVQSSMPGHYRIDIKPGPVSGAFGGYYDFTDAEEEESVASSQTLACKREERE